MNDLIELRKKELLQKIYGYMTQLEQMEEGSGEIESRIKTELEETATMLLCKNDFVFMVKIERLAKRFNQVTTGEKIAKRNTDDWNIIKEQVLVTEAFFDVEEEFIGEGKMTQEEYEEYIKRFIDDNEIFGEHLEKAKQTRNKIYGKDGESIRGEILTNKKADRSTGFIEGWEITGEELYRITEQIIKNNLLFAYGCEKIEREFLEVAGITYKLRDVKLWTGVIEEVVSAARQGTEYKDFVDFSPKRENEGKMTPGEYAGYIVRFKREIPGFAERLNEARNGKQEIKEH